MTSPGETPGHGAFQFLDLPLDLKINIIEELLGPSIASTVRKRLNTTQPTPFCIRNETRLQPNILRVSNDVFAIANTVLRSIKKWIIFDIDCDHLLLPQATHAVPIYRRRPKPRSSTSVWHSSHVGKNAYQACKRTQHSGA